MSKRMPRDPKKEAAILSAAVHEFAIEGYFKANTQKIADLAGVSKGSVFRYFDNKKKLYTKAVENSIQRLQDNVDFSIWTESPDLVSFILRAVKYKLALSHRFPDEFALLISVYQQGEQIPVELRASVQSLFDYFSQENIDKLIQPVIARLDLRTDISETEIQNYVQLMLTQMMVWIQQYMTAHPEIKKIEDMTEIIAQVQNFMKILEHGIVQE